MSLLEDTNPRALKDLLAEIYNRATILPDFQHHFVWEPGATQELIDLIANSYLAGSILLVRERSGCSSSADSSTRLPSIARGTPFRFSTARHRALTAAPARRLRGDRGMTAGAPVARDPGCHGHDGGRGDRS
jgi:hypothetical protein